MLDQRQNLGHLTSIQWTKIERLTTTSRFSGGLGEDLHHAPAAELGFEQVRTRVRHRRDEWHHRSLVTQGSLEHACNGPVVAERSAETREVHG